MTLTMEPKQQEPTLEQVLEYLSNTDKLNGLSGPDDVMKADEMVGVAEQVAKIIVKQAQRARANVAADRIYLTTLSMRDVASEANRSHNTVGQYWVNPMGPKKYVTVGREGDQFFIEAVPPKSLKYLKGAGGRRVAPSVWGLYDNETDAITYEGTAEELWNRLPELPAEE